MEGIKIKLSPSDADFYDYKNLKAKDKEKIDVIYNIKKSLLSEEKVDEYLSSSPLGTTTKNVIKEILMSFVENLKEQVDYLAVDCIIDMINEYSEKDYKEILKRISDSTT